MSTPCKPKNERWKNFKVLPTGGAEIDLGELDIQVDANNKIKGDRYKGGSKQEPVEGFCEMSADRHLMTFQILLGNSLYFFAGVITGDAASPKPTVNGTYFRALKIGPDTAVALAPDPGDTGGWGGNQGGF